MAPAVQKLTLSPSRDIPFNKLVLSQSNVRRVKSGVSVEELAEDIARRGTLLQSLNVRPVLDADGGAVKPRPVQPRHRHLAQNPPLARGQRHIQQGPVLPGQHRIQRGIHPGMAQDGDKGAPALGRTQKGLGRLVRAQDAGLVIDHHHGDRNRAQQARKGAVGHSRPAATSP